MSGAKNMEGGLDGGARDRGTMTPAPHSPQAPPAWSGVLSTDEWQTGVAAIGEARLLELRPMLEEVSPSFRAAFVGHLDATARVTKENRAVLLALARAADDAARRPRSPAPALEGP
jgi:hypothetical protein